MNQIKPTHSSTLSFTVLDLTNDVTDTVGFYKLQIDTRIYT